MLRSCGIMDGERTVGLPKHKEYDLTSIDNSCYHVFLDMKDVVTDKMVVQALKDWFCDQNRESWREDTMRDMRKILEKAAVSMFENCNILFRFQ